MTSISVADELAFEGLPDEVKHLARRVLLRGRRKRPKPNHNYKVGQDIYP